MALQVVVVALPVVGVRIENCSAVVLVQVLSRLCCDTCARDILAEIEALNVHLLHRVQMQTESQQMIPLSAKARSRIKSRVKCSHSFLKMGMENWMETKN